MYESTEAQKFDSLAQDIRKPGMKSEGFCLSALLYPVRTSCVLKKTKQWVMRALRAQSCLVIVGAISQRFLG